MDTPGSQTTQYDEARRALSHWRQRTLALLWLIYASFYLCRVNLASAQRSLCARQGLSKRQLGWILAAMKTLYAAGQLINGALADRFGPRRLIVTGLIGSAALNMLFAHLHQFGGMAITWALNGYFQACGWTPVVRIIANWFPSRLRDAASGIIGTSYILGSGLSWLLAGRLTDAYGWRYAFWVPAWVCMAMVVVVLGAVKSKTDEVGLSGIDEDTMASAPGPSEGCPTWRWVLASPRLWMLAAANCALIYGSHGLLDWTPHYLAEVQQSTAGAAAAQAFVMPLGGAVGCLVVTFVARRAPGRLDYRPVVACVLALAFLTWLFPLVAESAAGAVPVALFLLGACSSGPASLMACAMPANIATSRGAGTAAGLVDASAYVGSALSGWSSGRIIDHVAARRGQMAAWRTVWRVWPIGMLLAALLLAGCLARAEREERTRAEP